MNSDDIDLSPLALHASLETSLAALSRGLSEGDFLAAADAARGARTVLAAYHAKSDRAQRVPVDFGPLEALLSYAEALPTQAAPDE